MITLVKSYVGLIILECICGVFWTCCKNEDISCVRTPKTGTGHPVPFVWAFKWHFNPPMTVWTESWVSLVVRDHMCRLCVDLTPLTDSRASFTESKSTPHGTPSDKTTTFSLCLKHLGSYIYRSINHLPSMSILKMSFRMVNVVPSTNNENRKVQIGSAIFHSGCWFGEINKHIKSHSKM